MLNKSILAAGALLIALTGMQAEAMAGPKKKKFVKQVIKHHLLHHKHHRGPVFAYGYGYGGPCWRYKRNYLATGSLYWAEKWRVCQLIN